MVEEMQRTQSEVATTSPASQYEANGPNAPPEHPISYWEEKFLGKKLISEDETGDTSSVSKVAAASVP